MLPIRKYNFKYLNIIKINGMDKRTTAYKKSIAEHKREISELLTIAENWRLFQSLTSSEYKTICDNILSYGNSDRFTEIWRDPNAIYQIKQETGLSWSAFNFFCQSIAKK